MSKRPLSATKRLVWFGIIFEAFSILFTVLSYLYIQKVEQEEEKVLFEHAVERGMLQAKKRMSEYEKELWAGVGLFQASDVVTREEWRDFVQAQRIDKNFPGIRGFGYIERVPKENIVRVEKEIQEFLGEDKKIRTLGPPPPGDQYVIRYIEPIYRNLKAVGLDIGSEPYRRDAADRAHRLGELQITKLIRLVQDDKSQPGFLMLLPVDGSIPENRGWIYAPFVGGAVLEGIAEEAGEKLSLEVYDGVLQEDSLIFRKDTPRSSYHYREAYFEVGGQKWVFVWRAPPLRTNANLGYFVLFFGFFTSLGLLTIVFVLHGAYARTVKKLEAALRTKSDFLSTMSHEVRTPLNAILGFAELIRTTPLVEKQKEYSSQIYRAGQFLLGILNDTLDMSMIEKGKLKLEVRPFDLLNAMHSLEEMFRMLAVEKGLSFRSEIPEGAIWVVGDEVRLKQVFSNLLSNAIKFTERGEVSFSLEQKDDHYVFEIADTGIGIEEKELTHIFSPFSQANESIQRRFGGSGLGLSICEAIISAMHGTISAKSQPGRGTWFRVHVPLARTAAEPKNERGDEISWPKKHLRILVAEDNIVNQQVVYAMLERLGCEVEIVDDGEKAIKVAQDKKYDVILMDCRMPTVDGLEATRRLRLAGYSGRIVALTANASEAEREECLSAGMNEVISKPISFASLVEVLAR